MKEERDEGGEMDVGKLHSICSFLSILTSSALLTQEKHVLSQRIEENDEAIVQLLTYIGTGKKKTVTKLKNPPNPFDMTAHTLCNRLSTSCLNIWSFHSNFLITIVLLPCSS